MLLKEQSNRTNNDNKGVVKMSKTRFAFGLTGFGLILLGILAFQFIGFVEIKGHQAAVVEKFYGSDRGVQSHILGPGRHFYIPMLEKPYVYNVGTSNFIMGNKKYYTGSGQDYVDFPALNIKCGGRGQEQPATFSITLQYQLNTTKLKQLHIRAQNQYEERIIKPALTNIIKNLTVTNHVLNFYTGEGYNNLQKNVEEAIRTDADMGGIGIVVNTFVIDQIDLDPEFESEIQKRQLATQQKLRAIEEAAAAEEFAKKAEKTAEAEKLRKLVEAETKKQSDIKEAEASNQSRILAAKAEAEEIKEKATAERYRKEQDAKGLKAQGLAQADVDKARKMARYEGVSGARQAAVEIEQAKTERLKNMNFTGLVTENTIMSFSDSSNLNKPQVTIEATNVGK